MSNSGRRMAAQYMRMSKESQDYSVHHQTLAIAAYAAAHDIDIVRTYADEGISGLQLANRPGLKQLLADVLAGDPGFDLILTYDVSRWGRFQDPDESAHYEFLCRGAGVQVEYCAEPFTNDGGPMNALVKQMKRVMAGEYSRDLAVKVSLAQWNFARLGHWVGGPPGYGLRRQILHADGSDRWYIVYHRRPLGETDANHRVVSIDELRFGPDGRIEPVVITREGVRRDPL